jgi:hypothetical protein
VMETIAGVTLPAVLLVPGAWHKPDHLRPLVAELSGIDAQTVTLTSSGDDPAALGDMYADAEVIAQAAPAIDGPVVVVASQESPCRRASFVNDGV